MRHPIDVEALLNTMAQELTAKLQLRRITDPAMIGIRTGGVWLAEKLHKMLAINHPLGTLDINFYRDDFTRMGMHPQVKPSHLPFNVDDCDIILVDDVLHTGRTIRAALNEIFDYGRPRTVTLAVLVDRGGRELPIEACATGERLDLKVGQHVKLTGPEPLSLVIQKV